MNKRHILTAVFIATLLSSALVSVQFVKLAEANFMPMQIPQPAYIIRVDGTVDPSLAPIQRDGNVYTFTDNIVGYTVASERDNVVIDGGGYSLTGTVNSTGVLVLSRNGITVRNMNISNCKYGIRVVADIYMGGYSSGNNLSNNLLTNNHYGILISASSSNVLRNNIMTNNNCNFGIQGQYLQDVDVSNTVDGKPIIYWTNQQGKTVPSGAGYVALVNCTNITVRNLVLSNNCQGIVSDTTNSAVTDNNVSETENGIYIQDSSENTLTGNNIIRNGDGIRGQSSSGNNMSSNQITNNQNGIYFTGTSLNNVISGNTVASNTVDGINLWGSSDTDIEGNTITNNTEVGINFFGSGNNRISGNNITGNGNGIKFWYSTINNTIVRKMITENNGWGIQLTGTQNNNQIYHNSFINNHVEEGLQVSIPGERSIIANATLPGRGNVWDNGKEGNYWSDYLTRYTNATDADGSGIGDTPFYINEYNSDRHPLMNPISIPEFSSSTLLLLLLVTLTFALVIFKQKLHKTKDVR